MAVHRVSFSRETLAAIQDGSVTCTLSSSRIAAPGDVLLAGLPGSPPPVKLKVTGFRRGVPFLELTRRELERAGLRDALPRGRLLVVLGGGVNPTVNVIHFRLMKS